MSADSSFFELLESALAAGEFIALVLARPRTLAEGLPRKQSVRSIELRGQKLFQWELQFERQQTHLNLDAAQTLARAAELLGPTYQESYLYTAAADFTARVKEGELRVSRRPPSRALPVTAPAHNRAKEYLIPEGVPCPFLAALDVMTPAGQVKQSRQKKFRQINRYLEMVDDMYPSLPEAGPLHVVDFGCGLSYLTFAVHHLLTALHGRQVQLLGIDQNEQIIRRCRQIAADLQLPGLEFRTARIDDLTLAKPTDLAISLHACDTATDQALAMAVSAEARVILAAPCCQHELASSIQSPPLDVLLRQGILKERLAALATDALRAIALEAAGYRTQILEFIDLEHTPKNLLLRAVRRTGNEPLAEAARREYLAAKEFLGAAALATDAILEARGPGILMAP